MQTKHNRETPDVIDEIQTDYLGAFVYQNDELQFIHTAEGRALPPRITGGTQYAYEYFYTDHQGNLRMSFRRPEFRQYVAHMDNFGEDEGANGFKNVAAVNDGTLFASPSRSARLNSSRPLGPVKVLEVGKGDLVFASVKANYLIAGNSTNTFSNWSVFISSNFIRANPQQNPDIAQNNQDWVNFQAGIALSPSLANTQDNNAPHAYLKWMLYDTEGNFIRQGITYVTAAHRNTWLNDLSIALDIDQIDRDGTLHIFLANESLQDVFFDDFEVQHNPAPIVQENHYDPFGLNLVGIEKAGNHPNQFLTGNEKQKHPFLDTYFYETPSRLYHPALGRWMSIDPQDQFASPYVALGNNFINSVDPDGEFSIPALLSNIIGSAFYGAVKSGALYLGQSIFNGFDFNEFGTALKSGFTGGAITGFTDSFLAGSGFSARGFRGNLSYNIFNNIATQAAYGRSSNSRAFAGNFVASLIGASIPEFSGVTSNRSFGDAVLNGALELGYNGAKGALVGGIEGAISEGDFGLGARQGFESAIINTGLNLTFLGAAILPSKEERAQIAILDYADYKGYLEKIENLNPLFDLDGENGIFTDQDVEFLKNNISNVKGYRSLYNRPTFRRGGITGLFVGRNTQGGFAPFRSLIDYGRGGSSTALHEYYHYRKLLSIGYGRHFLELGAENFTPFGNKGTGHEYKAATVSSLIRKFYGKYFLE